MVYYFDISQDLIFEFESLLKNIGITIQSNSDLEKVALTVFEANAAHKGEIAIDNKIDMRGKFSDFAGIVDLATKIVRLKNHRNFNELIPHLKILNTANTSVMTTKSAITDIGNNKLMELYVALLCMSFATDVKLDNPVNSMGDNPDILFNYNNMKYAIACKALHSDKEETLIKTIEKGVEQINRSSAQKGIVVVNFKNIINKDKIWPILNEEERKNGEDIMFGSWTSQDIPSRMLYSYGNDYKNKMIVKAGLEYLQTKLKSQKCSATFLAFLQATTSVVVNNKPTVEMLKTFNLINFESKETEFTKLAIDLNKAMHDVI